MLLINRQDFGFEKSIYEFWIIIIIILNPNTASKIEFHKINNNKNKRLNNGIKINNNKIK